MSTYMTRCGLRENFHSHRSTAFVGPSVHLCKAAAPQEWPLMMYLKIRPFDNEFIILKLQLSRAPANSVDTSFATLFFRPVLEVWSLNGLEAK